MASAACFRTRSRCVAVWCSIVLIVVLAVPAWNRLRTALAVRRAHRAMRLGELETALHVLEGLDRTDPRRKDVCYLLGVANRRLGRFDEAFKHFQRAEDLGWPPKDVTRQRYMARFQAGDITGTQEYLQRLLVEGAEDDVAEELYEALAKGFLAEYRVGDAAVVLDHWIAWRPQAIQPRLWRAEVFEDDEDWNDAAEQYRKIVEIDPSSLSAHLGLADSLLMGGKLEAARAEYEEIRRRFPQDVLACLGLAQCERQLGESAAATELLEQVLEADVDSVFRGRALCELGQIALDASDYEQAAAHFEAALAEDARNAQTHYSLGGVYARLGRTEAAKAHLERSQAILDQHRRLEELADQTANQPSNVDARFEIATVLFGLGRDEEAARWLLTVIHLNPTHARARAALADFFASRGMDELAGAHRRIADEAKRNDRSQTRSSE